MWIPLFLNEQPISAMIESGVTPSFITVYYFKSSSILSSLTTTPYKGPGILVANGQNLIPLFYVTLTRQWIVIILCKNYEKHPKASN